MDLVSLLTMNDISVVRKTSSLNAYGEASTVTTITSISRGIIFQSGYGSTFRISDKLAKDSTHLLVLEPSAYSWSTSDMQVTQGGKTFKVEGVPDNVMDYDEIMVVGLRQLQ